MKVTVFKCAHVLCAPIASGSGGDFHSHSAPAVQVKCVEIPLNVKVSRRDLRAELPTVSGNTGK